MASTPTAPAPTIPTPLPAERYLFSRVITLVERYGRPVRLLIVPAATVADGHGDGRGPPAVVRRSTSANPRRSRPADQARLLGEAWERVREARAAGRPPRRPSSQRTRRHLPPRRASAGAHARRSRSHSPRVARCRQARSGRTSTITTSSGRRSRTWKQQLNGPDRDEALARIRETARPADELAAVAPRARLHPAARHRAQPRRRATWPRLLTDLGLEDQVVVFRVLPRKDAAAAFEYLSHEAQEALLKAMAQEDVAALLNDMAPDDRTMFLEELPAAVTRQLLALLTPEERAVAVNAARLSRGVDRAADDAALRRGPRGLDGAGGARLRPHARAGQRNAQRHLRRRRTEAADRRHPHPRVPADALRSAASPS